MYLAFGYLHALLLRAVRRLRGQLGQGTVEYVALILLSPWLWRALSPR